MTLNQKVEVKADLKDELATDTESAPAQAAFQGPPNLFNDLVDCLDSLVKVYRSLLDVVRREKEILVGSKLDELSENNKTKDAMLVRIRSLENQRTKCARDFAMTVGADVEHPRLLDISNHCPPEQSSKLRNMHAVLELLIRRVAEVNKSSEELVQAALQNITGAMDAIRDGLKPKAVYCKQGGIAPNSAAGGQLVSREA
jgi:flagellar biosynthesis/type III secretory pathway chaperone